MSQALYRKWRPHLWEQVVGQEHIIQTLRNAIRNNRVGHAYLFAGPRGTGKTTTARLLAKAVNCKDPDVNVRPCDHCEFCLAVNEGRFLDLIEIDAASNTSVDDIRDLRDKINFSPSQGKRKVYIIDEVHMLSTAAFNALLKTLEEPPAHAIFILATTEVHKIPATVLSRCQRHEFRRIPVNEIVGHLQQLAEQEGLLVDQDALTLIARQSTGAMRDAISLLDQLSSTGEKITLQTAQQVLGTATNQLVIDLIDAILNANTASGLNCIHQALDSGTDPRQFARQTVEYLRGLLMIRLGNAEQVETTTEMRTQMVRHAAGFEPSRLLNTIRLFNNAASDIRSSWHPGLLIEMAVAESIEMPAAPPAPTLSQPQPAVAPQKNAVAPQAVVPPASQVPPVVQSTSQPSKIQTGAPPSQKTETSPSTQTTHMQVIKQNWRVIREQVKEKSKPTDALLATSKLLGIKNGKLLLGFSTEVLMKKMENKNNIELLTQILQQVTGNPIGITCVISDSQNQTDTDNDGVDVDSDSMLGTALNLGGQIVHKE